MTCIGVVTGMAIEARSFKRDARNLRIETTGAVRRRTRDASQEFCQAGIDILLSFGLAGALDPRLRPGDIIVADSVVAASGHVYEVDTDFVRDLAASFKGFLSYQVAPVVGSETAVRSQQAKASLFDRSGGVAVDMESDIVAEVAVAAHIPFLVVRAISDDATHEIPDAALAGLGRNGKTRPLAVLLSLLTRPNQLPDVLTLASGTRRGLRSLRRAAPLIQEAITSRAA